MELNAIYGNFTKPAIRFKFGNNCNNFLFLQYKGEYVEMIEEFSKNLNDGAFFADSFCLVILYN